MHEANNKQSTLISAEDAIKNKQYWYCLTIFKYVQEANNKQSTLISVM